MTVYEVGQGTEYELPGEPVVTDTDLLHWRRGEFLRLGFDYDMADILSRRVEADLHKADEWLRAGATPRQVFGILGGDRRRLAADRKAREKERRAGA